MQGEILSEQTHPTSPHPRQSIWYVLIYFGWALLCRAVSIRCYVGNLPIFLFIQSCMEKCRRGNDEHKDFQKTEGEGPGFLCSAS